MRSSAQGRRARKPRRPKLVFVVVSMLCSACAGPQSSGSVAGGAGAKGADEIVLDARFNLCVAVKVDARVWPTDVTSRTNLALSHVLILEIQRLIEKGRFANRFPSENVQYWFFSDAGDENPLCLEKEKNVFVTIDYAPLPEGGPFMYSYSIRKGSTNISGSISRDILKEMRMGRMQYLSINNPMQIAIVDDLRARAVEILEIVD